MGPNSFAADFLLMLRPTLCTKSALDYSAISVCFYFGCVIFYLYFDSEIPTAVSCLLGAFHSITVCYCVRDRKIGEPRLCVHVYRLIHHKTSNLLLGTGTSHSETQSRADIQNMYKVEVQR